MVDPSWKDLRPRHLKRGKFMKEVNCNVLSSLFLRDLKKILSLFSDLASLHNPVGLYFSNLCRWYQWPVSFSEDILLLVTSFYGSVLSFRSAGAFLLRPRVWVQRTLREDIHSHGGSLLRKLCALFGPEQPQLAEFGGLGEKSILLGEDILREMEFKVF